jgi:hypothetical protein
MLHGVMCSFMPDLNEGFLASGPSTQVPLLLQNNLYDFKILAISECQQMRLRESGMQDQVALYFSPPLRAPLPSPSPLPSLPWGSGGLPPENFLTSTLL